MNTTFSRDDDKACGDLYVAPQGLASRIRAGNSVFDTGFEYRTQSIYGDELWAKLHSAGVGENFFRGKRVLELCAGNGFLTYHLLSHAKPEVLVVNDISKTELDANRALVAELVGDIQVEWLISDMHELDVSRKFDVVIGNSFLHHFYDVPTALKKIFSMLADGGVFITLHEPTPVATFVESGKGYFAPFAALAPHFMNNLVRRRYAGEPSPTDLWLFRPGDLVNLGIGAGFKHVVTKQFGLVRPIVVGRYGFHLSADRSTLSDKDERILRWAVRCDNFISRFLPRSLFGSVSSFFYR